MEMVLDKTIYVFLASGVLWDAECESYETMMFAISQWWLLQVYTTVTTNNLLWRFL